jgi:hypothetical protein
MKSKLLTIAVALASVLALQQTGAAKSTTAKKTATSKSHHKKHHKKTANMHTATPQIDFAA